MGDWPTILTSVAVGIVIGHFVHPIRTFREWRRINRTLWSASQLGRHVSRSGDRVLMPRGPTRPKVTRTGVAL